MRSVLHSVEDVRAWVLKKGGKACEWRICTGPGRAAEDDWNDYTDAASLPLGKELSLRVKGSKGDGVGVCIASVAIMDGNFCEKCGKDRSDWERGLATREQKLYAEKVEFVDFMAEHNLSLTRNRVATKELEAKGKQVIKDYYDLVFDSTEKVAQISGQMDSLVQRAQKAENYSAMVSSVNWTVNRAANLYTMSKVKKMEDIPVEWQERIQKFLLDESAKEFFRTLPESGKKLAEDFTRLPREQIPVFLKSISEWMNGQGLGDM